MKMNKSKMKHLLDRLGYLLIIVGAIVYLFRFNELIVYGTDYYINGSKQGIVKIFEKNKKSEKTIYLCRLENNSSPIIYTSAPTNQVYQIGSLQKVIISPTFKTVLFGKFLLFPYIVSISILFFLMIVSAISVKRIFSAIKKDSSS